MQPARRLRRARRLNIHHNERTCCWCAPPARSSREAGTARRCRANISRDRSFTMSRLCCCCAVHDIVAEGWIFRGSFVATSSSPNYAARWPSVSAGLARLCNAVGRSKEERLAHRLAGAVFLIRAVSAALAYVVQVLLARWMGSFEYGIYAYMWTWVMLLGSLVDGGMAASAQRFIPEYAEKDRLHRGFLHGSVLIALATSTGIAALGAFGIRLVEFLARSLHRQCGLPCLARFAAVCDRPDTGVRRALL